MVINKCQQTVWVGIGSQQPVPEGGGFRLDAGQTRTLTFPGGKWSGRLWGRTGCTFDGAGMGRCDTGDCGGRLGCGARRRQDAGHAGGDHLVRRRRWSPTSTT